MNSCTVMAAFRSSIATSTIVSGGSASPSFVVSETSALTRLAPDGSWTTKPVTCGFMNRKAAIRTRIDARGINIVIKRLFMVAIISGFALIFFGSLRQKILQYHYPGAISEGIFGFPLNNSVHQKRG